MGWHPKKVLYALLHGFGDNGLDDNEVENLSQRYKNKTYWTSNDKTKRFDSVSIKRRSFKYPEVEKASPPPPPPSLSSRKALPKSSLKPKEQAKPSAPQHVASDEVWSKLQEYKDRYFEDVDLRLKDVEQERNNTTKGLRKLNNEYTSLKSIVGTLTSARESRPASSMTLKELDKLEEKISKALGPADNEIGSRL